MSETLRELRAQYGFVRDLMAECARVLPHATALVLRRWGIQVEVSERLQQVGELPSSSGLVVTLGDGETLHEVAISQATPAEVVARVRGLRDRLASQRRAVVPPPAPGRERDEDRVIGGGEAPLPVDRMLDELRDLHRRARGSESRITSLRVWRRELSEAKLFIGPQVILGEALTRSRLWADLVVAAGERRASNWASIGCTGGGEQLEFDDGALAELRERAVALLYAETLEPGEYDFVADPTVAGTIAHEAFGHGVEADVMLAGRARAAEYLGRRVGASGLGLVDDPSLPGGHASYWIDDEGAEAAPTWILRDGVFERPLTNAYSAARLGVPRSANGRRAGFDRKVYARMSNTFFAPGPFAVADLIASVDRGILIRQGESGMEDPKGWGIQVVAHHGEEIRGGRLTGRLFAPVSLTGFVPNVLRSITMVADDLRFGPGRCGKGFKELIPISDGGPHVRGRARLG